MRNGNTTGLLRVILEVCLNVLVCMVTDDLCRVLISTYCTISTKTPELALFCTRCGCDRSRLNLWQAQVCYIIDNTDCETSLRSILLQLFVYCKYR